MADYNKVTAEIAEKLTAIVGENSILLGEAIGPEYSHDEMPIYGSVMPEVVCFVDTTEQVSEIMKLCNENKIAVTVRGSGTGLTGSCTPIHGGVIISTVRMDKILSWDVRNFAVTIQPGVMLKDLAAAALDHGLMYPPDPGEKTGTVGGNVSTNAGGMRAVKYGVTRDYVLAMTVVLATGEILHLGKTVCKTSSGYSLLHLMVGSEGTLGIITELTMKLIPKPAMDMSFILPFRDIRSAIGAVPDVKLAGIDPQSIEFMERDIVDSSASFTGNKIFPPVINKIEAGAYILVTIVGSTQDELIAKADKLAEVAEKTGAYDLLVVNTTNLKADVWAARSAFLTVIEAETALLDEMDVVVPVDKIADFLGYVHDVGEENNMRIRSFGHAGDGNLHIYCCSNDMEREEFLRLSKNVMDKCYAKCTEFGGQVSGEHGIGYAKKNYLHESVGDAAYGLMAGIKKLFDPNGILNPGKVCNDL